MTIQLCEVAYRDGDVDLVGLLAEPKDGASARPGVLLVPAVFGMTDHPRDRARMVAALGYTVFVADLFGGGATFASLGEAMPHAGALSADASTWLRRLNAALAALRAQPRVDATRLAAIGFCFGGTSVLELALSGADLRAAVSFHGGLKLSSPAIGERPKASILVCNGGDDPLVPDAAVAARPPPSRRPTSARRPPATAPPPTNDHGAA